MSDSVKSQIRDYFAHVDKTQGAVDIDAVLAGHSADRPAQPLQPMVPPPPPRRGWAVALIAAAVIAVAGLMPLLLITASDEPDVATSAPVTTEPPVPTTEVAESQTTPTPTTAAPPTTTSLPAFPPIKESLSHGSEAWAVYLAVGVSDDPALGEAALLLQDLGFRSGVGDLGCDWGAGELLGLDPTEFWDAVAMYFETEAHAEAFVEAMEARGHGVVGWGLVHTYCMD